MGDSHRLQMTLLSIDDVVSAIPDHMSCHADPYWEDMIRILLKLVAFQLKFGFSVVVDLVFMGEDRTQAYEISSLYRAAFRPIYTYLSDDAVWEKRVRQRWMEAPLEFQDQVATWEKIPEQRKSFFPWKPRGALFVDGVNPIEANLEQVLAFITKAEISLEPL